MKTNKIYYFSVEGETEKWYLDWLEDEINCLENIKYKVKIDAKVCPNAKSRAKGLSTLKPIYITHVIDVEGKTQRDIKKFENALDYMKAAEKLGKKIKYKLAYSNLSFELWLLLHKTNQVRSLNNAKEYLSLINEIFNQSFSSFSQYKQKKNYEKILAKLSINDVTFAIRNAKRLEEKNKINGLNKKKYGKYEYYLDNPSTSACEIIEQIFEDCKI